MLLLFLFFVFFPYVDIVNMNVDTQPNAMIMSIIIVMLYLTKVEPKIPHKLLILLVPCILSLFLLLVDGITFNAIRSVSNYLSVLFISWATYIYFRSYQFCDFVISLKYFIYIWFFVGLVQFLGWENFGVEILPRSIGSNIQGRGVVGLSPEPTFYGLVCLFMLFFSLQQPNKKLTLLLLVQIVIFSRSSMAILLLLILLSLYVVFMTWPQKIRFTMFLPLFIGGVFWALSTDQVQSSRAYMMAMTFMESPEELLNDGSVKERMEHIKVGLLGFYNNYGLPVGFEKPLGMPRIMSGFGSILYELGVFGAIIIFSFVFALKKYFKENANLFFVWSSFFVALMFTAIPVAFPLFGFLLGYLIYFSKHPRHQKLYVAY